MTAKHDQWKYVLIERHITKGIVHFVPPYTLFEMELDNGCRYVGLAQLGHNDVWSERIGYDVAYGRAMKEAIKYAESIRVHDAWRQAVLLEKIDPAPQVNAQTT